MPLQFTNKYQFPGGNSSIFSEKFLLGKDGTYVSWVLHAMLYMLNDKYPSKNYAIHEKGFISYY